MIDAEDGSDRKLFSLWKWTVGENSSCVHKYAYAKHTYMPNTFRIEKKAVPDTRDGSWRPFIKSAMALKPGESFVARVAGGERIVLAVLQTALGRVYRTAKETGDKRRVGRLV